MDIRTGRAYDTREAALSDGAAESDIAEVTRGQHAEPKVKFSKGSFKAVKQPETAHQGADQ